MDTKDQIKELNDTEKDFVETAAELVDVRKPVVTKLFGFLKKKVEDGNSELDDIAELSELLGM